ncbi:MAG TPA: ComEC/Rec2 family competence protein [Candidatus Pacearchaeota archaeon]|nr:ComEC family competence protein [Candidatus Parcubacteria bacterium]HNZ83875.1 ComEC/Rec2 family competence protein [Candidatus Pacearchaeota archaeon]HPM08428.1 ComEC/Rec2 family competence protein [Candidatus Pacearchaeota archaeon]
MTKSECFFWSCFFFVVGVGANSIADKVNFLLLVPGYLYLLAFLFLNLIFFKKQSFLILSLIFGFFFILGAYAFESAFYKSQNHPLALLSGANQEFTIIGTISQEPGTNNNKSTAILKVEEIQKEEKRIELSSGKIMISSNNLDLEYGDKIELSGMLKKPNNFNDFDYRNYLAKDGIYGQVFYPRMKILKENNGNWLMSEIISLRKFFRSKISYFFSGDKFSLMDSLMIGDKYVLDDNLKEKLKVSGLSHIIAISGMHVTIFAEIIISMFLFFGLYKKQAISIALIFTIFFIVLSGFQISALRAGIMGGIYMISKIVKRQTFFLNNFLFSLAAILASNPLLLRHDIGLQLSFTSILGIFYLSPEIKKFLKFLPNFGFLDIQNVLAMTISAQIFTFPIVVYHFQNFYPLGIFANLLIVPFASFLMISGLFLIISSSFWNFLGYIFFFPALAFVSYFEWILNFFYRFKTIFFSIELNLFFIFVFYFFLGYNIYRITKRNQALIFQN